MTTLPDIEKDKLSLYALREQEYEQISRSELLSGLDIALLTRCIMMPNHVQAIREFMSAIA